MRTCALSLLLLFWACPIASAARGKAAPSRAVMAGEVALQKGSPEQAIAIYEAALLKRPRSKKLIVSLILAKVRLNQCEESRALLLPFSGTRVANRQVLEGLAACFSRLGEYSEAVYWAEERVLLAPPADNAYASLSSYRRGAGDRLGAIEALSLAEQLEPHSESVLITKLQVAVGKGDVDEATFLFAQLDDIGESRSQMNWFLRAKLALDLGDFKGALEASDACLKIRFQFSPVRALRGEIFRRMGQLDSADVSLNEVYDNAIGVVGLQAIQIRLLADQGRLAEAHELLESVQLLAPLRPDVVASAWYLAHIEGHLQQIEQGRALYELVQYNPYRELENLLILTD